MVYCNQIIRFYDTVIFYITNRYIVKITAYTFGAKFSKELNCPFRCTDYSIFLILPAFLDRFKTLVLGTVFHGMYLAY